ncbi:hypothetical protein LUZ60_003096 [Juncus effusus]|nr:hypothetical protein LUZ60_003096 [Juncus effusus]
MAYCASSLYLSRTPSTSPLFSKSRISPTQIRCISSVVQTPPPPSKTGKWRWYDGQFISIHYESLPPKSPTNVKSILMVPTISDVSTVEEWRAVASDLVNREGKVNFQATIVDWPGLGFSDRPSLNYTADFMERFLVEFINSQYSPINENNSEGELIVCGGGHAATIAIRAAGKGLIKPKVITAVAPTWAGPLPIVFGRDSTMESRYGFLRGALRAPALGQVLYNTLVSNKKSIESQYKSHVYSDPANLTPQILQTRYELTTRKGARFVPAAFLTGLLDPVRTREEMVELVAELEGKVDMLVVSSEGAPKRSKAEMEALEGKKGVKKYVRVKGALLPHEEFPGFVSDEIYGFLQEVFG